MDMKSATTMLPMMTPSTVEFASLRVGLERGGELWENPDER